MSIKSQLKPSSVRRITDCRICAATDLLPFIDLGLMPSADNFIDSPEASDPKWPLSVVVCTRCWLVQLETVVARDELFNSRYSFFTGASPGSIQHFQQAAKELIGSWIFPGDFVVEIGSNDGTFLEHFIPLECRVLGVDPSASVAQVAERSGVSTIVDFFDSRLAARIISQSGHADVILASNVLAHVDDVHDFLAGLNLLLAKTGICIIEVQYLPNLLFGLQYDNIYHEHQCYFSLRPLLIALGANGLILTHADEIGTQGGSLRLFIRHAGQGDESIARLMAREEKLHNPGPYVEFASRVEQARINLLQRLAKTKRSGLSIAGYGASAKSTTLLNYCGIDTRYLDYIWDLTPYKDGKYTPGTHIPICLKERKRPDCYLLLVWNYLKRILEAENTYLSHGGHFIVPSPEGAVII